MATLFDGVLFPQSLQDLVKGIRAHRRDEAAYIRGKIAEITTECRASEPHKKANGVLKLTYVMSRTEFAHKRVGYLAAGQVFSPTTDVLLLTTNLFKKDITAGRLSDCSHALNCVAKVATAELARELAPDVVTLLASPRPYIRKKATLTLYSLVAASPDILPAATVRLKDRLVDSDPSVVCAAVTVVAQLAAKSPRPFLVLAPVLYRILTDSHNNWLLIKVVKLFGVLAPLEPRLARKLAPPLTALMKSTKAKSLLYECCSTVSLALLGEAPLVALAADHLGQFIMDADQNLKYLGLAAMRRLAARFPTAVMPHRGLVLDCLDDADVGIRLRALDLVGALLHQDTFREVFDVLLDHLEAVAAVAGRASVAGLAGSGGATEEDGGGAGGGAGRHALSAIDTDAPFREVLATRLLDAGVFVRPTAPPPPAVAAGAESAPRRRAEPSKPEGEGAAVGSAAAGTAAAPSPSTAATPVSDAEAGLSTISLADPAPVDKEAARKRTGGYLQLLTEDDFEWYVAEVLGCVARCSRSLSAAVTGRAAAQLVELPARVPAARPACVELALQLLQTGGERAGAASSGGDGASATAAAPAPSVGTSANAAAAVPGGGHGASNEEEDSIEEDSEVTSTEDSSGLSGVGADSGGTAAAKASGTAAASAAVSPGRHATPLPAALLAAAAWLIGEYAPLIPRPATGVVTALLEAVPAGGGARCVSSALKLYASVACSDTADAEPRVEGVGEGGGGGGGSDATELRELLLRALPPLAASAVAEVQERASVTLALVNAAPPGSADAAMLRDIFAAPLLPVDAGAQARLSLPPPAAAAGVDLSVPLLGPAERARLARDAAAAAAVDEADRGMEGGRASGRSSAAARGAARGREASSLLSAGGGSGGDGGGRVSSRRGGVAPRRPRGDRPLRGAAATTDAAMLIDVAAGDDGSGGGGGSSAANPRGGSRSRSAAAAILADVAYEPAGAATGDAPRGDGAGTAGGAAAAADSLYGELDFGIGGSGGGRRADAARSASTGSGGGGGGGVRRTGSSKPAKPRRKARPAAAGDSGDVGTLVDLGEVPETKAAPPRKARAAKGARTGTKKAPPPPPPPPTADSFLQ